MIQKVNIGTVLISLSEKSEKNSLDVSTLGLLGLLV